MSKIWLPLLSAIGVMALFYWMGNLLNLSLFRFSFALYQPLEEGWAFEADIAMLPLVIGLIVGFIVEYIGKVKSR